MKKLIMIIIIMNKSQETTVFRRHQKLTSAIRLSSRILQLGRSDRLKVMLA